MVTGVRQDMFSIFEKGGLESPVVGMRYRKDVLERGALVERRCCCTISWVAMSGTRRSTSTSEPRRRRIGMLRDDIPQASHSDRGRLRRTVGRSRAAWSRR